MEPIQVLAGSILALFLSEAAKAGGKSFGESTASLIKQLRQTLWGKIIKRKNMLPDQMAQDVLEAEVVEILKEDESLAEQAALVVEMAQSDNVAKQTIIEFAKAKSLTLEGINQKLKGSDLNGEQTLVRNADIEGSIRISNVTQSQGE